MSYTETGKAEFLFSNRENETRLTDHQDPHIGENQGQIQVMGASRLILMYADDVLPPMTAAGELDADNITAEIPHEFGMKDMVSPSVFRQVAQQLTQLPDHGDRHDNP